MVYSSLFIDPQQRTYMHVGYGAVVNPSVGAPAGANLADSVALNGSNSQNGTRGHAVQPDLEGITISQAPPAVNYVYDEPLASVGTAAPATGTPCSVRTVATTTVAGTGATFSGNVRRSVPRRHARSPGNQVVRATVGSFACAREATASFGNTVSMTATAPGTGGFSSKPDLTAVTVDASRCRRPPISRSTRTSPAVAAPAGSLRVVGSDGVHRVPTAPR